MKTISAEHISMMLGVASKRIEAERIERKIHRKGSPPGTTPQQLASWLMAVVADLQVADGWSEDRPKKGGS